MVLQVFFNKLYYEYDIFLEDKLRDCYFAPGEMAERSNAAVLKPVDSKGPGVRIPLSPPNHISKLSRSSQVIDSVDFFIFGIPQNAHLNPYSQCVIRASIPTNLVDSRDAV